MPNRYDDNFTYLTRTAARWISQRLALIVSEAITEDETGYLDRMNPELPESRWMLAVIRFLQGLNGIIAHNLSSGLPRDMIDMILEDELAANLLDIGDAFEETNDANNSL